MLGVGAGAGRAVVEVPLEGVGLHQHLVRGRVDQPDGRAAALAHRAALAVGAVAQAGAGAGVPVVGDAVCVRVGEVAARDVIRAATARPVTCGHELSTKLDGPKRALTSVLNARLISLIHHLITATETLFEKRGILHFDRESADPDQVLEAALEAGAEDVVESGDVLEVVTAPGDFDAVRRALIEQSLDPIQAAVSMEPTTTVALTGDAAQSMLALADSLEDLDDVQNVYANFDIPDEEMAAFG